MFFLLSKLRDFVLDFVRNNLTKSTLQLYNRVFKEFIYIVGNNAVFNVTADEIE